MSRYAYVTGDPLSYIDPFGLDTWGKTPSWSTLDFAGMAAVCNCNFASIVSNKEYGNWITLNGDGSYGYARTIIGDAKSIPGFPSAPSNAAGWYHTHGAYDPKHGSEIFSPNDKIISNTSGVPGYLGTPSRAVKKYIPGDVDFTIGTCP